MKRTITILLYAFIFTFLIGVGNCDVVGISGTEGMVESRVWRVLFEMLGKWNCRICWKYCLFPFNFSWQNRHWIRDPNKLKWAIFRRRDSTDFLSEKKKSYYKLEKKSAKVIVSSLKCFTNKIAQNWFLAITIWSRIGSRNHYFDSCKHTWIYWGLNLTRSARLCRRVFIFTIQSIIHPSLHMAKFLV